MRAGWWLKVRALLGKPLQADALGSQYKQKQRCGESSAHSPERRPLTPSCSSESFSQNPVEVGLLFPRDRPPAVQCVCHLVIKYSTALIKTPCLRELVPLYLGEAHFFSLCPRRLSYLHPEVAPGQGRCGSLPWGGERLLKFRPGRFASAWALEAVEGGCIVFSYHIYYIWQIFLN